MAETEGYTYRVLTVRRRGESEPVTRHRALIDLGLHPGRTPEDAIEHAVDNGGLPSEDGGRCIAVPVSRWHERDVKIKQVPEVRIEQLDEPEDDITADPR